MKPRPIGLVIFDCDGVLIDSEPLCNRIIAEDLTDRGWPLTGEECQRRFIGLSFPAMVPLLQARLGSRIGPDWVDEIVARVTIAMAQEVEPVPGAREALTGTTALGIPWRIASNSSHEELAAKFTRTGLADLVAQRTHSAHDVIARGGQGKPAPDLFLEAAAAEAVDPAVCVVIEDSVPGVRAAIAAGMRCLGLSREDDGAHLRAEGATPFHSMFAVVDMLRAIMKAGA